MLIPSHMFTQYARLASLSRRVNANSQLYKDADGIVRKLIKKGEC